jgi:hypothetical protein
VLLLLVVMQLRLLLVLLDCAVMSASGLAVLKMLSRCRCTLVLLLLLLEIVQVVQMLLMLVVLLVLVMVMTGGRCCLIVMLDHVGGTGARVAISCHGCCCSC